MKKLLLALLFASYGTCIVSSQALQSLSEEEYAQQFIRMDRAVEMVQQWKKQLCEDNIDQASVIQEVKSYLQNHPELAEVYIDYFDTTAFSFNVVDLLLVQVALYQENDPSEGAQRLVLAEVLEQAGVKRTLSQDKIEQLAALALGKYSEVAELA